MLHRLGSGGTSLISVIFDTCKLQMTQNPHSPTHFLPLNLNLQIITNLSHPDKKE